MLFLKKEIVSFCPYLLNNWLIESLVGGIQQKPAFLVDAPQPIIPASTMQIFKLYFSDKLIAHDKPV